MRLGVMITTLLAASLLTTKAAAGQGSGVPGQPAVPPVLTESHKREILNYLDELKSLRKELELIQRFIVRDEEQDKADREIAAKKLQLVEQERDQAKQQADHFKALYESLSKRRTIGCKIKMILSFGLARCR